MLDYLSGYTVYRLSLLYVVKEEFTVIPLLDIVNYVEKLSLLKVSIEAIVTTNAVAIRRYKSRRPII